MRNLFRPPSQETSRELAAAVRAVAVAMPLSAAHKRDLPNAVRDLSRMLTSERHVTDQPYWSSPRLLSAYCRYFLPWNLQRMAWLLPGLRLGDTLRDGSHILDLGSGPLTLPLALWTLCPELRPLKLSFTCVDVAPHPMNSGKAIFDTLAGESPWRFEFVRSPLDSALRAYKGKADLIMAGNVLNEIPPPRRMPLARRLEDLARLIASRLAPEGRFLSVEPGTRLGGKLIALLRGAAIVSNTGLVPESPCPHNGPCPMLDRKSSGWCHFSVLASGPGAYVPMELLGLTRRARLEKRSLSLSCLVLRHGVEELAEDELGINPADPMAFLESVMEEENDYFDGEEAFADEEFGPEEAVYAPRPESGHSFVRILSDPIQIPGREKTARYACSERGLTLVHNAGRMPSGAALTVHWPEDDTRDPKTGALEVELPEKAPARTAGKLPGKFSDKPSRGPLDMPSDTARGTSPGKFMDPSFRKSGGKPVAGPGGNASIPSGERRKNAERRPRSQDTLGGQGSKERKTTRTPRKPR